MNEDYLNVKIQVQGSKLGLSDDSNNGNSDEGI